MKCLKIALVVLAALLAQRAMAFSSSEEQITSYVHVLDSQDADQQEQLLSRLQWAGLSDPALFDVIERKLLSQYQTSNYTEAGLMAHYARALGYSGNEKYRPTLELVSKQASSSKLRSHAKRALTDLPKFGGWWAMLPNTINPAPGQSIEAARYEQMLNTQDVFVQRLAARAMFHEHIADADLLNSAATLVKNQYRNKDMDGETEDTLAWLCKAIGENAAAQYHDFLATVAKLTPSRKIAKYARSYVR
ncbi:hypothetical protein ACKC9G_09960 [Pokkaliibacter sp. CJK22405]|uniref:hypothetical protein n=1 Tax=Pokkaliibacter sp. CJK22405 TaxID=3384615 RepID=UPI003985007E